MRDLQTSLRREPDVTSPNLVRVGAFVGLLAVFAGIVLALAALTGVGVIALAPLYMFTPLAATFVLARVQRLPRQALGMRVGRWPWLVASALLAPAMVAACLLVALLVPGVSLNPDARPIAGVPWPSGALGILAALGLAVAVGTTVNAVLAFGEEIGWRGYLLRELAPLGFWKASWVIGAIWGLWHAPVILAGYNYPSFPVVGVGMMTLACMAFSPLYTFVTVRAQSVLAPTILHGVFNGSAGAVLVYTSSHLPSLAQLVASPVGLAGIVVFGAAAVVIGLRGAPSLEGLVANRA